MRDVTIRLEFPIEERIVEVDSSEAIGMLFAGVAKLHEHQKMPPVGLVDALIERTGHIDHFGERAAGSADLDKISSALTPSGVLQYMVKGEEIPWLSSGSKLLLGAEAKLGLAAPDGSSLVAAAQSVLTRYRKHNPQTNNREIKYLAKRAMENRRLWGQSDSPEWENFIARLAELQEGLLAGIKRGLLEARILCAQSSNGFSSLLHPNQAARARFNARNMGLSFCFTLDLPNALFGSQRPIHKRREDAAKFMKRAYLHFREQDRYASVDNLKTVAAERFQLTENAVQEAWKGVRQAIPTEPGNKKADLKVSINEINNLE